MLRSATSPASAGGDRPSIRPSEALLGCLALALLMVSPAWRGDFVVDDLRQIVANPLIQQPGRLGEALVSDVWSFRRTGEEAASNYWRPAFVLWLGVQVRLFGLDSTLGWHLALAALHGLVGFLVYRLGGRLGLSPLASALLAAAFVLHPVHVESVAWISGAPDPLMSLGLLGSLLALLAWRERGGAGRLAAAGGWYALALASKEAAVPLSALVPLLWAASPRPANPAAAARTWRLPAGVFVALALAYLGARHVVLGRFQIETPTSLPAAELAASAPRVLLFYLRHALWPEPLGFHYPLRPALLSGASPARIALEWAALGALLLAGAAWARRDRRAAFALAVFLVPLVPALNLNAFLPEQIVHSRYLYLPVLGVLLAVGLAVEALLARARGPVLSAGRPRPARSP